MTRTGLAALSTLSLCLLTIAPSRTQAAAEPGRPKFAAPRFAASKQCSQKFEAKLTEDSETLSVLRVSNTKNSPYFLAVGSGFGRRAQGRCSMEIRLAQALVKPETLNVDVRGSDMKAPNTRLSYVIGIGHQSHVIAYAIGRWLDGSGDTKRFQVPLAVGTKALRIKLEGEAVSQDGKATAFVDVDSLDLCIVNPTKPDGYCASAVDGQPASPAAPTSSPM